MGRKRRRRVLPSKDWWCYYCDRRFDDSHALFTHQSARHFSCCECGKRLSSAFGLHDHAMRLHRIRLTSVPNALKGRVSPFGRDRSGFVATGPVQSTKVVGAGGSGSTPRKQRRVEQRYRVFRLYSHGETSVEELRAMESRYVI